MAARDMPSWCRLLNKLILAGRQRRFGFTLGNDLPDRDAGGAGSGSSVRSLSYISCCKAFEPVPLCSGDLGRLRRHHGGLAMAVGRASRLPSSATVWRRRLNEADSVIIHSPVTGMAVAQAQQAVSQLVTSCGRRAKTVRSRSTRFAGASCLAT